MKRFSTFLSESKINEAVGRKAAIAASIAMMPGMAMGLPPGALKAPGRRVGSQTRTPIIQKAPPAIDAKATPPAAAKAPEKKNTCWGELCNALERAETGSFKNKFIRTTGVKGSSSTAFGPAQITGSTLKDSLKRSPKNFPDKDYTKSLIDQSNNFAKYGREPNKSGYEKRYDYGGSGNPKTHDVKKYRQVAVGVLKQKAKDVGVQPGADGKFTPVQREKLVTAWRGKNRKVDPRYFKEVDSYYKDKKSK